MNRVDIAKQTKWSKMRSAWLAGCIPSFYRSLSSSTSYFGSPKRPLRPSGFWEGSFFGCFSLAGSPMVHSLGAQNALVSWVKATRHGDIIRVWWRPMVLYEMFYTTISVMVMLVNRKTHQRNYINIRASWFQRWEYAFPTFNHAVLGSIIPSATNGPRNLVWYRLGPPDGGGLS